MEKLVFDSGVRKFQVNGDGVLQFNPSDMNVYTRFLDAAEKIQKVEADLVEKAKGFGEGATGEDVLRLMSDADREVKKILQHVFGEKNDFDAIMGGVNVMAVAGNGERVITNFLEALFPIIAEGAQNCARERAQAIAAQARMNRAQRRAAK